MNKLITELTKGSKRYPNSIRDLSEADIQELDTLFSLLNRMARDDRRYEVAEARTNQILYGSPFGPLYLVNSDHFEDAILDSHAYNELRLQMSTGDFHSHTAKRLTDPTEDQICAAMYWDEAEQAFMPY